MTTNKLKYFFIFVSLSINVACIYKIGEYVPPKAEKILSIQAELSDEEKQHQIKLFLTATGLTSATVSEPITKAEVFVTDSKNNRIDYFEDKKFIGNYLTKKEVKGEIGETYRLHIKTPDGKSYISAPETMVGGAEIKNIYTEPTIKNNLPDRSILKGGYDIYIDFDDPATKQYYSWSWVHYTQIVFCASCQFDWDFGNNTGCVQPRFFETNNIGLPYFYRCTPGIPCYDISKSSNVNILNDALINGNEVKKVFINRIPYADNANSFPQDTYYVEISQSTLNQNTYNYYRSVEKLNNSGTIFDIPALTNFSVSIVNENNKDEKIIGVFDVRSVKTKSATLKIDTEIEGVSRKKISFPGQEPCPVIPCPIPCMESDTRTKTPPKDWIFR